MIDLTLTDNRWKELREEFFEVQKWAREDIDSDLRRRVFVRTMAASIEGCVNMLSFFIVSASKNLSAVELSILNDTQYDLKENGEANEREKYYSCASKWRLIVRVMERELGTEHWSVGFSSNNFNDFKMLFKIRNRITHPKVEDTINLTDAEMDGCVEGYRWFIKNYQGICKV